VSKIDDIKITTIKDFPDNIIMFLSGKININRLDKELESKKIILVKIKND